MCVVLSSGRGDEGGLLNKREEGSQMSRVSKVVCAGVIGKAYG